MQSHTASSSQPVMQSVQIQHRLARFHELWLGHPPFHTHLRELFVRTGSLLLFLKRLGRWERKIARNPLAGYFIPPVWLVRVLIVRCPSTWAFVGGTRYGARRSTAVGRSSSSRAVRSSLLATLVRCSCVLPSSKCSAQDEIADAARGDGGGSQILPRLDRRAVDQEVCRVDKRHGNNHDKD
jgi:hypothetical protein